MHGTKFAQDFVARRYPEMHKPVAAHAYLNVLRSIEEGFMLFKLVSGLIIGIAVVVGGVGVMNVLLMSINERTSEIGIRKAVGASRSDIVRQFLSESLAISVIGCVFGIIGGMAFASIAAPVVRQINAEIQFRAVFSWSTLLLVAVTAVLIGVIFGTYPARKASRLDAVDAIRK